MLQVSMKSLAAGRGGRAARATGTCAAATAAAAAALLLASLPSLQALDNGLGLRPPLAWSTWNRFGLAINESLVLQIADALVATGLRDAGFLYINVDAGAWLHERDANGDLQANPALFPGGMQALASAVHARGLKLGHRPRRGLVRARPRVRRPLGAGRALLCGHRCGLPQG